MTDTPRITIAIPTRNRFSLLEQTLSSLAKLSRPVSAWEVVVVDNGSTDGTLSLLQRTADSGSLPLRFFVEPTPGSSNVRNRAIDVARGEYILFTDDDVQVEPDWLLQFEAAVARHPSAAAFGGVIAPWFAETPDPHLAHAFPELATGFCGLNLGDAERPLSNGEDMYAANLGFRRHVVAEFKFNPRLGVSPTGNLGFEESDLQRRMRQAGHVIMWVPTMRVAHYVPPERMTPQYLTRFVRDRSRAWAWFDGKETLAHSNHRVFGVPLWLWRECATAWMRLQASRLSGNRQAAAHSLARIAKLRGWIDGCRVLPPDASAARQVELPEQPNAHRG